MELFNKIVIIVAIVLFGIALTWFGVQINSSKSKNSSIYPPTFSSMPDYWETTESGYARVPTGRNAPKITLTNVTYSTTASNSDITPTIFYTRNPGSTPGFSALDNTIDFSNPAWNDYGSAKNLSPECRYKEWAVRVGITWDGITNFTQCV